MPPPKPDDLCSLCGERADHHGSFGFRDHAHRDKSGKSWDIDWNTPTFIGPCRTCNKMDALARDGENHVFCRRCQPWVD